MSLISYIINLDELLLDLNDKLDGKTYRSLRDIKGKQRIKGFAESIPALEGTFRIAEMTWDKNIILTGATFSQSAWKGEDYWSFWVDDDMLFDEIYTKEIGDQKHWELIHVVKAGETAKFLIHNISGNSRNVWVDLEWVELIEELEGGCPVEPEIPVDPEPNPEEPVEPNPPNCTPISKIEVLVEPFHHPTSENGEKLGEWKTIYGNEINSIKRLTFLDYVVDIKLQITKTPIGSEGKLRNRLRCEATKISGGDSIGNNPICCIMAYNIFYDNGETEFVYAHLSLHPNIKTIGYDSLNFETEICNSIEEEENPTEPTPTPTPPTTQNNLSYFCDNSISSTSINTSFLIGIN